MWMEWGNQRSNLQLWATVSFVSQDSVAEANNLGHKSSSVVCAKQITKKGEKIMKLPIQAMPVKRNFNISRRSNVGIKPSAECSCTFVEDANGQQCIYNMFGDDNCNYEAGQTPHCAVTYTGNGEPRCSCACY